MQQSAGVFSILPEDPRLELGFGHRLGLVANQDAYREGSLASSS